MYSFFSISLIILATLAKSRSLYAEEEIIIHAPSASDSSLKADKKLSQPATELVNQLPGVFLPTHPSSSSDWSDLSINGLRGRQISLKIDGREISEMEKELFGLILPLRNLLRVDFDSSLGSLGDQGMGGELNLSSKQQAIGRRAFFETSSEHSNTLGLGISFEPRENSHQQIDLDILLARSSPASFIESRRNGFSFSWNFPDQQILQSSYSQILKKPKGPLNQNWQRVSQEKDSKHIYFIGKSYHFFSSDQIWSPQFTYSNSNYRFSDPRGEVSGFPGTYLASETKAETQFKYLGVHRFFNVQTFIKGQQTIFKDSSEVVKSRELGELKLKLKSKPILSLSTEGGLSLTKASDAAVETSNFVGVTYQSSIYRVGLRLGRSFRLPSLEEKYVSSGPVIGNTKLQSERAHTLRASQELNVGDQRLQVTAFLIRSVNLIEYILVPGFRSQARNISKTINRGLSYLFNFNLPFNFSIDLSGTRQNHLNDNKNSSRFGKQIPGNPSFYGTSQLRYLRSKGVWLGVTHRYSQGRFLDEANEHLLNDEQFFDLKLGVIKNESWSTVFTVSNIFNKKNFDMRGNRLNGRIYSLAVNLQGF